MPTDNDNNAAVALKAQTNSKACAKRLDLLIERSFGDLQFLLDEFSKLEVVLAPQSKEALGGDATEADPKLVKLRFFISHVRRTMARMRDARSGRDPLSMPQLALLEEHIATSIAPVKERLVSQMDRASGGDGSGSSMAALTMSAGEDTAARGRSGSTTSSGGGGTRHEVSATDVEEGGHSTSRSSSISSSMGGGFGGESVSSQDGAGEAGAGALIGGGGQEEDEWSVGMELNGDVFGTGGSVSLGLVSPAATTTNSAASSGRGCCSSSCSPYSRATPAASIGSSFSRLCWGGGVCGGGGLDLIGGGRTPLEQSRTRRDHLDMLSQLEAEGVFAADDSYSPCGRDPGMLGGVAFSPFMGPGAGKPSPSRATGVCGEGDDDLSPVPPREVKEERNGEKEEGGGAARKAPALVMPLKSAVKKELVEEIPAVGGSTGAVVSASPEALGLAPVSPGATVPREKATVAPGVEASGVSDGAPPAAAVATSSSVSSVTPTPFVRPKCEPAAASTRAAVNPCSHAAAGEARAAKPVATTTAAAKEGAPTTPVFSAGDVSTTAAATRSAAAPGASCAASGVATMAAAAAATVAPLPSVLGGIRGGGSMLLVPPRPAKRRRSSTLPAALLQPREVRYQCGVCNQSYAATVTGNPWWLLVRQECPACHKMQIPRVDILNPTNNVERHIAFLTEACAETGSDGDGSFMDWDGDTSDDNSGDEYSGDERDAQGSSAGGGALNGGGGGIGSGGGGRNGGLGASLDSEQAAKLLVLMCHARDCPGNHKDPRLAEVCRSVKFLMLHLRDCDGRTRTGQPCPFPWCQPCTSLLHHLIQCPESAGCQVCNPLHLPSPLRDLRTLNHSSRASSPTPATPSPSPSPSPPPAHQEEQEPRPPPQLPLQQLQQHQAPHAGPGSAASAPQQSKAGCSSSSASSPVAAAAASATAAVASATVVKQEPAASPDRATHEQ